MINIKNLVMGIAIFILTIFVGIYGISTLYKEAPQYDDYCPNNLINQSICEQKGGTWASSSQVIQDTGGNVKPIPAEGGYCQYDYTLCQKDYDSAQEQYYKKVFYTALPLGIAVIFLGTLIFGLEFVGAGIMAGGIGIIFYGAGEYWRFAEDWLKFALSLVGLVLVIWLGYYFNKKWKKKEHEGME